MFTALKGPQFYFYLPLYRFTLNLTAQILYFFFPGTVIKTFNVTDPDPGASIHISVSDPTTIDYVTFNQTQGNNVRAWVILNKVLDRDRVC